MQTRKQPPLTHVSPAGHAPLQQTFLGIQVPLQHFGVAPPQAGPVPHVQVPLEQVSAVMPQLMHAAPLVPQADGDGVTQLLPEQQPLGQLVLLHAHVPLTQAWPLVQAGPAPHVQAPLEQVSVSVALHVVHTAPLVPQVELDCEANGTQAVPLQQPFGQLLALQTHCPLLHV